MEVYVQYHGRWDPDVDRQIEEIAGRAHSGRFNLTAQKRDLQFSLTPSRATRVIQRLNGTEIGGRNVIASPEPLSL